MLFYAILETPRTLGTATCATVVGRHDESVDMTNCKNCGHPVAFSAWICQNCGSRWATDSMMIGNILLTIGGIAFLLWIINELLL